MKFKALALVLVGVCCGCAETVKTPVAPAVSGWHLGEWVIDSHVHVHPSRVAAARLIEVFDKVGIGRFVVKSAGTVDSPKYQATLARDHRSAARTPHADPGELEGRRHRAAARDLACLCYAGGTCRDRGGARGGRGRRCLT